MSEEKVTPDAPPMKVPYQRKFFAREEMGFGKHKYSKIDPAAIDIEEMTTPPGGVMTREFNAAFNKRPEGADATLDHVGRIGAVLKTDAPGHEGTWEVVDVPALKNTRSFAVLKNKETGERREISTVELGVVADRETNLFTQVTTAVLEGASAGKEERLKLTKLTNESYKE